MEYPRAEDDGVARPYVEAENAEKGPVRNAWCQGVGADVLGSFTGGAVRVRRSLRSGTGRKGAAVRLRDLEPVRCA